jgi:hypothetical protein
METLFAMLKHLLGVFMYRFWSKRLPRHSRKPAKNAALKTPQAQHLPSVQKTWEACERFVMLGCIALGLLQPIALKFQTQVWDAFTLFLRTRSRALASEKTVRKALDRALLQDFHSVAPSATMQIIRPKLWPDGTCVHRQPADLPMIAGAPLSGLTPHGLRGNL